MSLPSIPARALPLDNRSHLRQGDDPEWDTHKDTICALYAANELKKVMEIMDSHHMFKASEKLYKTKFSKWGIDTKRIKPNQYKAMLKIKRQRGQNEPGKATVFKLHGEIVPNSKIERWCTRMTKKRKITENDTFSDIETPPSLTFRTPTPSPVNSPPSSPVLVLHVESTRSTTPVLAHSPFVPSPTLPWLELDHIEPHFPETVEEPFHASHQQLCDSTLGLVYHPQLFGILPWFRFLGYIESNLQLKNALCQLPASHMYINMKMIQSLQALWAFVKLDLSLDKALTSLESVSFFEQAIPENFDGEIRQKLEQILDTSGGSRISHIAELSLGLISNNAMPEQCVQIFLGSHIKYNYDGILRLCDIDTPSAKVLLTKLLEMVCKNRDKLGLESLLHAVVDRRGIGGARGGRLLQISAQAGGTDVAKFLVENGADVNPELGPYGEIEDDEIFGLTPLHHAVHNNDVELAKFLLEKGAQFDVDAHSNCGTPLSFAIELQRLECILLMLEAGAEVDTCQISHHRPEFDNSYNLNALDYTLLACLFEVYHLLLPWSQKAETSATIHGILCAAEDGVEKLRYYLDERPQAVGQRRKAILEEALVESHYFPGHEEAIDTLLHFEVDPNVPTCKARNKSALLYAIPRGYPHVKRLLDAGAKVQIEAEITTAASKKGSLGVLATLIHRGGHFDVFGYAALQQAIMDQNLGATKLLHASGLDLNDCRDKKSLMHIAARWGGQDIIEYLLRHRMDPIGPPDSQGYTPLHYAVEGSNFGIVKFLIDRYPYIISQSEWRAKVTLLEVCANSWRDEHQEIFRFLLERGASINGPRDGRRCRPLYSVLSLLIRQYADDELVFRILNKVADVNEPGSGGFGPFTPIQAAATVGNLRLVKELYKRGADVNAPAGFWFGRTALQAACGEDEVDMELVSFLLDNEAEVNAKPGVTGGVTALQAAAIKGHVKLATFLLGHNAEVNAPPAIDGKTALEGAAEHGRLDMVQLLLNHKAVCEDGGYSNAVKLAQKYGHWAVVDLLEAHSDQRVSLRKTQAAKEAMLMAYYSEVFV